MAINEQQVMQAIYDIIYDSLTQAPPGSTRPAAKTESTFLTLAFPGIALDETQFADPWSPVNPNGSPTAAENLALLTDTIPELSPLYADTGLSVDRMYGQIVNANVVSAPTPSTPPLKPLPKHWPVPRGTTADVEPRARRAEHPAELFKAAVARVPPRLQKSLNLLYREEASVDPQGKPVQVMAETPLYREYLEKRAAYNATVTRLMADRLQRKVPAAEPLPPDVSTALRELERPEAREVEAAISDTKDTASSNVASLFSAARLTYELTKRGSLYQPGLFWHMCQTLPANWSSPSALFAQVQLQSDSLRLNPASRFLAPRVSAALGSGLWRQRAAPAMDWAPRPISRDLTQIRISYRFARVEVRRPWLDPSLLSLSGWSLPGRARHALSTGTPRDNPGIFSLLPASMIIARDVRISARWTTQEAAELNTALAEGRNLGFGPFAIAGASARPGGLKQLRASFDGLTISVPGLQLIGWLNKVVPACPPLDG